MKKILLPFLFVPLFSVAQLDGLINKAKDAVSGTTQSTNGLDIASGLKEALDKGIDKQVSKLTATDGFYKNQAVKILFPEDLKKVDKALRSVGMGNLADEGIKSLNRAAEDAVKEATPVFVSAVKNMTFTDAKNILMGSDDSATKYLQNTTTQQLYSRFNPVVKNSIGKVGADKIWANIIKQYNKLPLVSKINPDINDYVTNKALEGVFTMIAVEEKDIRTNLNSRSTDLLRKVFALQDSKK
ncbi:DUF4197 domain-containing protein [Flavobacterium silvaticum]|uniref:DUF4197 domain-containing protein n=1 Tax=Flavobacterium silvaticum TaxID=1852020 RepID=A0A972FKU3_9FLAO|nr:DUF4197 domain-containing protein [Flavobacterium silvaticum]NMH27811.1 DUF4197 domain-containing protein [Flavobacterium silvaticum]